jgi:bifunctional DNA-binding transcriptional regulator/antitoxin component of YhaV-PrlF toxin-antitoxin module
MDRMTVARVTTSGQVSLPAPVRRRWQVAQVVIEDEGDRVVVRPLPNDPIAAACGSLRRSRTALEIIRKQERRSEGKRGERGSRR